MKILRAIVTNWHQKLRSIIIFKSFRIRRITRTHKILRCLWIIRTLKLQSGALMSHSAIFFAWFRTTHQDRADRLTTWCSIMTPSSVCAYKQYAVSNKKYDTLSSTMRTSATPRVKEYLYSLTHQTNQDNDWRENAN